MEMTTRMSKLFLFLAFFATTLAWGQPIAPSDSQKLVQESALRRNFLACNSGYATCNSLLLESKHYNNAWNDYSHPADLIYGE
jgi:hypothetical protein